ncbi:MAG: hypothetical protein WCF85_20875 [Rhodospirillaceae bacterium]
MFRLFCAVWAIAVMVLGPMTSQPLTPEQNKRLAEKFIMLTTVTPPADAEAAAQK